jgi:dCMP deaminase
MVWPHHAEVRVDDAVFLLAAGQLSSVSSCTRRRVGAVVVRDGGILGTGYNKTAPGYPRCSGCPRSVSNAVSGVHHDKYSVYDGATACYAVHAEVRAILAAGVDGCVGATLYVTCRPCLPCSLVAASVGISRVVYPETESEG